MDTYFYVIGVALILIALAISFIGMRNEKFPSDGMLRGGVLLVALVVVATAYGAVKSAQDEQTKREAEENVKASAEEELATADNEASGALPANPAEAPGPRDQTDGGPAASGGGGTAVATGDPEAGAQVFVDQNCGSCHSLADAGATGAIGPNLDEALVDKDTTFIETSIVDPGAEVEAGFSDGIMPVDYGDTIPPEDLANLVAYLAASTSGAP